MTSLLVTESKTEAHPEIKRLLWFVFAGTRGGITRIKIVSLIKDRPINTNQLSREIRIDYKAIQHHIKILEKNNLITDIGERYGKTYLLSSLLESNIEVFDEIINKLKESIKKFSGDVT